MPKTFLRSRVAVLFSASLALFCSGAARADDLKEAEKLYGAAAKDMAAGNYERACPKFEAARDKAPEHVRTGMTLAQCYAEWGKAGSAYEQLQRVRILAAQQNKPDKVQAIDEQLVQVRKKAPKLEIQVPAQIKELPGLSIVRNGKVVTASQWDASVPVDPGTYRVEATAAGKDHWETSVDVREPGKTVTVMVSPNSWNVSAQSSGNGSGNDAPPSATSSSNMRVLGFVGLGLGAAGLAAGGILGGLAISKNKDGAAYCNAQNACTRAGYDLRLDAYNLGNGSTAAIIAGGVLLGAGVVLVALSPSKKPASDEKQALHVETWIGPSSIGMRGSW